MRHAYNREANVVGAVALALADSMRDAVERAGGHGASGPAALVALDGLLAGTSIDRLARVCGLSHSGAVRLADRLAQDGLVQRRTGADGRSVALALTTAGRRSAARIRAQREAAIETALAPLEAGDRAALTRAAELMLAGMVAQGAGEDRICRLCDTDACGRPRCRCPVAEAARATGGAPAEGEELNPNAQP